MEIELQDWFRANIPEDEMLWKQEMYKQVLFVRDTLPRALFFEDREEYEAFTKTQFVLGEHTSKSITLPVYRFVWSGVCCTLRHNFYDWKITVESIKPILNLDKYSLFDSTKNINPIYCEGFKPEWVLGNYTENNQCFTIELATHFDVYCFFKILSSHSI